LLAAVVYVRYSAARIMVTILWPAILLFPGVFLFFSPVSKFLSVGSAPLLEVDVGRPAPVVVLLLDECCGTSLMDENRRIDPVRYPNLAALAEDATWFRNATTMSPVSDCVVPSILTGDYPTDDSHPGVICEHPRNLFTLLAGSHELAVWENVSCLCPQEFSGRRRIARAGLPWRMYSLLIDVAVLDLHIMLPPDWPFAIPAISTYPWCNFLGQDGFVQKWRTPEDRRREAFEEFVASIGPSQKPGLYFAHVMLPHVPWTYTPSGKEYPFPLPADKRGNLDVFDSIFGLRFGSQKWPDDEWAVLQAQQRYLLQLGFTDLMIGRLIARLKATGLYDRSLIVIMADHGVSFRPGDSRRRLTETNFADIMSVPLLIKSPHQRDGAISDRNVQSADVLPTIAQALQIELPWKPDGVPVLDDSVPPPDAKEIAPSYDSAERLAFDAALPQKYDNHKRMLSAFGSGSKPGGLFRIGRWAELIGRRVEELDVAEASPYRVELVNAPRYANLELDRTLLPCYIGGRVIPEPQTRLPLELAVAVNRTVRAATRTFMVESLKDTWAAMVPQEAFRAGNNEIEVFVVSPTADGPKLHPMADYAADAGLVPLRP